MHKVKSICTLKVPYPGMHGMNRACVSGDKSPILIVRNVSILHTVYDISFCDPKKHQKLPGSYANLPGFSIEIWSTQLTVARV